MKNRVKIVSIMFLISAVMIQTGLSEESTEKICEQVNLEWLRQHAPVPSGEIVSKLETGPLCQVILNIRNELIPVFAGKDFIIAGEMMKKRQRITQMTMNDIRAGSYKKYLPLLRAVSRIQYMPENFNGRTMYLITDPLCPYCKKIEEILIDLADTFGVEIKAVLYSVHGDSGEQKAAEALCKNVDLKTFISKDWENSADTASYQCRAGKKNVEESRIIIQAMGINSVPKIIMDDGRYVDGADEEALLVMLESMDEQSEIAINE